MKVKAIGLVALLVRALIDLRIATGPLPTHGLPTEGMDVEMTEERTSIHTFLPQVQGFPGPEVVLPLTADARERLPTVVEKICSQTEDHHHAVTLQDGLQREEGPGQPTVQNLAVLLIASDIETSLRNRGGPPNANEECLPHETDLREPDHRPQTDLDMIAIVHHRDEASHPNEILEEEAKVTDQDPGVRYDEDNMTIG